MRIALFATGPVGRKVAAELREAGAPPEVLVVDASDESAGEIADLCALAPGRVLTSEAVADADTLELLTGLELELGLLAWWPYLLRHPLLGLPRLGFLNLHPSYLPHDRGKHYNFWTIVDDSPFGVSLHWVTEGIDDGEIAFQGAIEKTWEDTGESLYLKAQEAVVELFRKSLSRILASDIPRIPQPPGGSFHLARELDGASRIELDEPTSARRLLNVLRARTFPPHPGAWFEEDGARYEVRVEIRRTR